MANANISHVTLSNTFSDWRDATNKLANSANELRNGNYYKDTGPVLNIKNGRLSIERTSGVSLNVAANANVQSNFTTKTKIVLQDATYNGDDARFSNSKVIVDIANTLAVKNLTSNAFIYSPNTTTTDLVVGSDTTGNCWIQGDPYPAKTPLYVEGEFQSIDRGFNFYGNSIASIVVTANVSNTKIVDLVVDVPLLDGASGVKGQKGQKGQPGVQGDVGVQGSIGAQGYQGVQGAVGHQGSKGLAGDTTGGVKGVQGDKGEFGYGQLGDDGEKGQKGESIGATKGQKGSKGEKGILGDEGNSPPKGQKGDKGESGGTGIVGDEGAARSDVIAYVSWVITGYGAPPIITSSNNISSFVMDTEVWSFPRPHSTRPYRIAFPVMTANFITAVETPPGATTGANNAYAIVGSGRKPNWDETSRYYACTGNLVTISRNYQRFRFTFMLAGDSQHEYSFCYAPNNGSVIAIGSAKPDGNPLYPKDWMNYNGLNGNPF